MGSSQLYLPTRTIQNLFSYFYFLCFKVWILIHGVLIFKDYTWTQVVNEFQLKLMDP